ncbi:MAG: glutamate racemase [Alphaproteobacteria bacterium]|nr:glutamate racemase [Alphaproteobacteria bacterium]
MKIGIFDSGLGGLIISKSIIKALPQYDYIYLGDTKHVPYGPRSFDAVYQYTKENIEKLFELDCQLVIIACNTASARALRNLQQNFLPQYKDPSRRILGVIIPTIETIAEHPENNFNMLATPGTKKSQTFDLEIQKLAPQKQIETIASPLLVPMIEYNGVKWIKPILKEYTNQFKNSMNPVILGCTHYPALKEILKEILPPQTKIISQDEIIPEKLKDYLKRHLEIEKKLSCNQSREFLVTDLTDSYIEMTRTLYGQHIEIKEI